MKVNLNKLDNKQKKEFLRQYSILMDIDGNSFFKNYLEVSFKDYLKVKKLKKAILNDEDTTYLTGYKYWYKDRFKLMKNVFVPQYDTEGILDFFDESKEKGLEIGVGTGVISISLAKHFNKEMTGIDINKKALRLTAENAGSNGVLLELKNKDLFNFKPNEKFDFLVTNPPYISYEEEVEEWVENNQPKEALYATDDGLAFYKYLLKNKDLFLKPKGRMIFEIGYNQKEKLTKIVEELNVEYNFMKDLSGNWRFLEVRFND